MKFKLIDPPRQFEVGIGEKIKLSDCAHIELAADEQITLKTESGAEYDVARKSFGYYATPSLNGRLLRFNLRAVLVRSPSNQFYVFLVEKGKESHFERYVEVEKQTIVSWLDNDASLNLIERLVGEHNRKQTCPMCGDTSFTKVFHYDEPPKVEIRFNFSSSGKYKREILSCKNCAHFISVHEMDTSELYSGDYVTSNYGDEAGIVRTFEKIIGLDPSKSDNEGRARRVNEFADKYLAPGTPRTILDIGSGLCVFLYRMKKFGWDGTALDPDARSSKHAREHVGVKALTGDFMTMKVAERYNVVTLNKVLEHVADPIAMLKKVRDCVSDSGFVYIELPDGEEAARDSKEREEFTIDHLHCFSAASMALLAQKAGFTVHTLERLREPSSKYTLRAFLTPNRK